MLARDGLVARTMLPTPSNVHARIALALFATWFAAPKTAAAREEVSIWYRSSEGCPDGAEFLAKLGSMPHTARLANVGDRIDFVVTLGRVGGASSGRLERETQSGTVAIREVRAIDCLEAAEALALTLELALEPQSEATPSAASPSVEAPATDAPESAETQATTPLIHLESRAPRETPETHPANHARGRSATDNRAVPQVAPKHDAQSRMRWGVQGGAATGLAPAALPALALFGELGSELPLLESVRWSVRGAYRELEISSLTLGIWVMAGRVDACPIALHTGSIVLKPCIALDLGVIGASNPSPQGRQDFAPWASGSLFGRALWELSEHFTLEAQLGGFLPFVRYELVPKNSQRTWYRTAAAGLEAAVGVAFRAP